MEIQTALLDLTTVSVAAGIIRKGGLVVFPTETVYGLGADGLNRKAVERIFSAKERPPDNPLILHIADPAELHRVAREVPELAEVLLREFSPGPLSLVLPRSENVPEVVSGGLDTVAVRIPSHPVAQLLIRAARVPIAAPSANRSGRPSPTTYRMALDEMKGRAEAIIDGGDTDLGIESTVVRVKDDTLEILRPGSVTREMIRAVLDESGYSGRYRLNLPGEESDRELSPGTRHSHYKPRAEVYLSDNPDLPGLTRQFPSRRIGFLLFRTGGESSGSESSGAGPTGPGIGRFAAELPYTDQETPRVAIRVMNGIDLYARRLYRELVWFDSVNCDMVIVQPPPPAGIGEAIRDRLERASDGRRV